MTYFGVLAQFLGPPLVLLALLTWYDNRRGKPFSGARALMAVALHVVIAVVYTTPWDNYLVATNVWWYDEDLVTGITLGWVPIEEYTFFVVQAVFSGLLLLALLRYVFPRYNPIRAIPRMRYWSFGVATAIWLGSVGLLFSGWDPGTYLALELSWGLLPMMVQLIFGADILWQRRRLVFTAIFLPTLYLSILDAVAIDSGTWTIDPEQSTGLLIAGVLPVEELIFFTITNVLLVFGMTLLLTSESRMRAREWLLAMGLERLAGHDYFAPDQPAVSR